MNSVKQQQQQTTIALCIKIVTFPLIALYATTAAAAASPVPPALAWNEGLVAEMKKDTLPPPLIARNLAILHSSLEKAYLLDPNCSDRRVHLAAYKLGLHLLPSHALAFEQLFTRHSSGAIADEDREFADRCATPILETLTRDGASRHVTYFVKHHPGAWNRTAPFFREAELAHWAGVTPLFLKAANQFRPPGPPPLSSPAYARAVREIQEAGHLNSHNRTADQTQMARFWSDFSYTETPVGHWNSIARDLAIQKKLPARECARLFHRLNASLADTAIACWEAKYFYTFWRPISAIQRAEEDENPDTIPEAGWVPLLNTPSHPDYVSGHSAFSGAASQILFLFFETDELTFEVRSDTLPGVVRTFDSLRKCATECGESRIFGGIHFRFSCEDGFALGKNVAGWVWSQSQNWN